MLMSAGVLPRHDLEKRRHAVRVEAGVGQRADADAVSFVLVTAGEVDLLLRSRALCYHHACLHGVTVARRDPGQNRAQHQCRRQDALPLTGMDGPRDVPLRDVRDLVGQHAGEFVFIAGRIDQAGMHTDVAAGQGEGIDIGIVDDEEREALAAVVGLRGNAVAHFVDVLGDLRVFDDPPAKANLRMIARPI